MSPPAAEGERYERGLDPQRRKAGGVFYTPAPVVKQLVADALGRVLGAVRPGQEVRVVDPACGAGAFLVAAYQALLAWHERLYLYNEETTERALGAGRLVVGDGGIALSPATRRQILKKSIFGVDVDPEAVRLTRAALARVAGDVDSGDDDNDCNNNIKLGNALLGADAPAAVGAPFVWAREFPEAFAGGGFDVVFGNPPFIDAEAMARHHPSLRRYCAGRYEAARGNWDLFCVFIELGLRLCAPHGYCAMIVPNKLASADYAAGARSLLTEASRLVSLHDYGGAQVFGEAVEVYPLAFVARRAQAGPEQVAITRMASGGEPGEVALFTHDALAARGPWPIFGGGDPARVAQMRAVGRPLGELAEVWGAATVGEAYAIAGLIVEGEVGLRVVNSGTIDRCAALWGRTRLRYLGRSVLRPVIAEPERLPRRRLVQARTPKVIVASMTRTLEAIVDRHGEILAGKSTTICWWPADLRLLVAIIHSRAIDDYYQQVHGGDRLGRGYLRVGPPQLRRLPVPDPGEMDPALVARICAGVDAWSAGDSSVAAELDALVDALYGLT